MLWAIDKLPRADTGADAQKIIKVINLLLPHSDLNKADAQGETPLLAAINTGQRAIIKRLLADPRTAVYLEDNNQKSAINWAEEKHDQWLLGQLQAHPSYQQFRKKPLTAKKKKESDNSPRQLVLAAKKGNLELLLAGGRSPDQDCAGWTPLIVAAKAGHCDIVSSLLKQGADPNRCYKGWPALLFALHYGWIEVAQLLLDQPTTQLQLGDGQNNFPLLLAAKRGQYKLVKQLLEKGADPNQQDDGPTALIAAAEAGQFACAEILLEYGADPNRWTDIGSGWGGCTALMQAVNYGHVDIAKLLINRRETFGNPVDIQGWTPLLWAIQNGYSEVAEILISSGNMDLNYPRAGDTALTLAIRERQLAIVTRLLAEPDLYCKKTQIIQWRSFG